MTASEKPFAASDVVLRSPRAGDLGWLVHRHGALYAQEYGYNDKFEAVVARVVADFIEGFDVGRERCWIAEHEGRILGSVMLARETNAMGKLRLLYLEPEARGIGLGRRLLDTCVAFAREAGYRKVTLWTQDSLSVARHIYETAGFALIKSVPHSDFGPSEVAQTWELNLSKPDRTKVR